MQKAELDDAVTQLGQLKLELQKSQSEVQAEKAHATALVTEKGKANQRVHELRKQIVDGSEQMRKEVEEVKKQVGRSTPDVCLQTSCAGACAMLASPHFVFVQMSGWLEHEKRLRLDADQRAEELLHEVRAAFCVKEARAVRNAGLLNVRNRLYRWRRASATSSRGFSSNRSTQQQQITTHWKRSCASASSVQLPVPLWTGRHSSCSGTEVKCL